MDEHENYRREMEKLEAVKNAEQYQQKFGTEKVDFNLITNYVYDNQPGGDQRR